MDSKHLSEVQSVGNHSVSRANAIRMVWLALTAGSLTVMGTVVQAGGLSTDVPQRVVSFKDLNLNSPAGAAVLYGRIKAAAYAVCANPNRYDLSQWRLQLCIKESVAQAVAKVNRPMLTSLYEAKTGKIANKVTLAQTR